MEVAGSIPAASPKFKDKLWQRGRKGSKMLGRRCFLGSGLAVLAGIFSKKSVDKPCHSLGDLPVNQELDEKELPFLLSELLSPCGCDRPVKKIPGWSYRCPKCGRVFTLVVFEKTVEPHKSQMPEIGSLVKLDRTGSFAFDVCIAVKLREVFPCKGNRNG